MPKYDFLCTSCGSTFEAFRSFAQGTDDVTCPDDDAPATRQFSPPLDVLVYGGKSSQPVSSIRPPTAPRSGSFRGHGHSHAPGTGPHSH